MSNLESDSNSDSGSPSGSDPTDVLLDATTAALPPLLAGLDALTFAARHMHPPNIASLAEVMQEHEQPLSDGLETFAAAPWPDHLQDFRKQVVNAATMAGKGLSGLVAAADADNPVMQGYRSLGYLNKSLEYLYPLARILPPVSRFFLSPDRRDDIALLEQLNPEEPRQDVGVFHFDNEATDRGGFSMFVPENYDPQQQYPLVFALHGGSGHGRSFLWSWLVDARAEGAIVVSPSSREGTWSLMGPDVDTENLHAMLAHVQKHWSINPDQLLLSGMSDGGTFSYVAGLPDNSPFTHLAPTSASFHPMLLEACSPERLQGLPIYLTHGGLDWMFAVDMARTAQQALSGAGAQVEYREIDDLSHTFPREENVRILRWLRGDSLD